MFNSETFFNWAFARHQNQLSWYIRPLFLVPFCYFAYQRNIVGVSATIFFMLTSMFWFPVPAEPKAEVVEFLNMEKEWLVRDWIYQKVLISMLVPVSLTLLGAAFWRRSIWLGVAVLVLIAAGKIAWSILYGGESGKSILLPAALGLLLCISLIYWRVKKLHPLPPDNEG